MPQDHEYYKEKNNPDTFLNRATKIGINTVTWVKKELDAAVGYAYSHNIVNHTSIKSILQKKLYLQTKTNILVNTSVLNDHDNLRGNIYS